MDSNNFFQQLLNFNHTPEEEISLMADALQIKILNEILNVMEQKKINRSKLATETGVSRSYISQIFSVDKPLSLKMLARIEKILKIKFQITSDNSDERDLNLTKIATEDLPENQKLIPILSSAEKQSLNITKQDHDQFNMQLVG